MKPHTLSRESFSFLWATRSRRTSRRTFPSANQSPQGEYGAVEIDPEQTDQVSSSGQWGHRLPMTVRLIQNRTLEGVRFNLLAMTLTSATVVAQQAIWALFTRQFVREAISQDLLLGHLACGADLGTVESSKLGFLER